MPYEHTPGGSPDLRCFRVNRDKALRILKDFRPQWTAKRGAAELYETYKRVGVKVEDFEGPRFQRIAHIRKLLADDVLDETPRFVSVEQRLSSHGIH